MINPWIIEPLDIGLRLLLAVVIGGLIGIEREQSNHAAGFRTHILVCLGSALIMLLSIYGFADFVGEEDVQMDPARLAAQVISGIGFLGAGAILRNGLSVSGLTTAASLWVVAAIGLSVGAGFYFAAVLASVFVIISLWILNKVEKRWFRVKRMHQIKINVEDLPGHLSKISSILTSKNVEIRNVSIDQNVNATTMNRILITLTVKLSKNHLIIPITEELGQLKGVSNITLE